MGINRVVILGGGPIGLFCAIEASLHFNDVWIIEKRPRFTRLNVPQVSDEKLHAHLVSLDPHEKLPRPELGSHFGSIKQIERTLLEQAVSRGVTIMRPYVVRGVQGDSLTSVQAGGDADKPHRYKRIRLTYRQWDDGNKKMDARTNDHVLGGVDLLVVATGGGAVDDPLVIQNLGFKYEKLKAKNYMAYGIFEPSPELEDVPQKEAMSDLYDKVTGGRSIAYETGKRQSVDLQYFLPALAGITKKDFKDLKASRALLQRVLVALKSGHGQSSGVLESMQNVEKNMLAFKIQIQRAQQFYSPTFPAVLVGDAAVTPHPDSGSGLVTGFRGFEELKVLFKALAETSGAKDDVVAYQDFNERYELHVSKKALDGTVSIIENLAHLCAQYANDLLREHGIGLDDAFRQAAARMKGLELSLKTHERLAKRLLKRLQTPNAEKLPELALPETASKLWADLTMTYREIKEVTKMVSLLEGRIGEIEKLIAAQ